MRRLGAAVALAVLGPLLLGPGLLALWSVHRHADPDPVPPAAAIIVLSGDMRADGGLGVQTAARVARGVDLFRAGAAPVMVMTGHDAATAMRNAAVEAGVPPGAILTEDAARSTLQNALNTGALLGDPGTVLVVTHRYHLPRSMATFRWAGFAGPVGIAADAVPVQGRSLLREAVAGPFNLVRVWVVSMLLRRGLNLDGLEPLLR